MNNFKDIKSIYNSQDTVRLLDVPDQLKKKIKRADRAVNSSHIINIIILVVTFLVVACSDIFFFKSPSLLFQIGIITMLSALFIRIGFEIFSYQRKKSLNVLNESENFMKDLKGVLQLEKENSRISNLSYFFAICNWCRIVVCRVLCMVISILVSFLSCRVRCNHYCSLFLYQKESKKRSSFIIRFNRFILYRLKRAIQGINFPVWLVLGSDLKYPSILFSTGINSKFKASFIFWFE